MGLKTCPCCHAKFECSGQEKCWCNGIRLSQDVRAQISEAYSECLCESCLWLFADPLDQDAAYLDACKGQA